MHVDVGIVVVVFVVVLVVERYVGRGGASGRRDEAVVVVDIAAADVVAALCPERKYRDVKTIMVCYQLLFAFNYGLRSWIMFLH